MARIYKVHFDKDEGGIKVVKERVTLKVKQMKVKNVETRVRERK